MHRQQRGFTLIELVVVITLIAIIAAFALPRFADLATEAHSASIQGSSGAYSSAIALARSQWTARGARGEQDNLPGFGAENVDVSDDGWPTGVNGNNNPDSVSQTDCAGLWNALLQSNAPEIGLSTGSGAAYIASVEGGACRYTYDLDGNGSYIEYDPSNGEVVVVAN